jgi:putative SOS response-associated peptidase YedK
MCYSAGVYQGKKELIEAYTGAGWLANQPFPGYDQVSAKAYPVVPMMKEGKADQLVPARWLLVPDYAKTLADVQGLKIWLANARIEELEQKQTYKPLLATQRCAVVFTHFFEWRHQGKEKIKYQIFKKDKSPLILPGLWKEQVIEGKPWTSCTICTMEARGIMEYIHNTALRMPVITNPLGIATWLDSTVPFHQAREQVLIHEQSATLGCTPGIQQELMF